MIVVDIVPQIIDMHYGVLRGVGFHTSEPSDIAITKTVVLTAAKKGIFLTLGDVTNLYQGQLIVYHAGGEYYTNVIKSITGSVLQLNYPLEADVLVGDTVHNFYLNYAHPNIYGYRAIADIALRQLQRPQSKKLLYRILPSDFSFAGTGSVADGGFAQDYTQPFTTVDTKVLTITTGQDMIATKTITFDRDVFLKFKTHVMASATATVNYQISDTADTVAYYNKYQPLIGRGTADVIEAVVYLAKGSYHFKLQTTTAGSLTIGKTEIFELGPKYDLQTFNKGVHLCMGDSWFVSDYQYYLRARLAERFPNATFHDYGVGGNEIGNLLRRFTGTATGTDINDDYVHYGDRIDATVIPVIDFVWVMCGTNDYFSHKVSATFKAGMEDLMNEILDRGAKPLIFTSSVGQVGVSTNFTLSREYADLCYGLQYSPDSDSGTWTPTLIGSTVAGANTYSVQTGLYCKHGKLVMAQFNLALSAKDATMAGALKIGGLPFAPAAAYFSPSFAQIESLALDAGYTQYSGFSSDGAIMLSQISPSGTWNNIGHANATDTAMIRGSIAYLTA